ncbi:hypothetical protein BK140_34495, partial [Paenibacillus macerans]
KITTALKNNHIYYQIYTNRGIYTEDPKRDLAIYIDIAERAGQKADVDKIRNNIQKRIDNGTLKVVDNYDSIEDIPGELIMKVLAFDADLSKIDQVGQALDEVKHIAKYVTDTNENSGVGKAIMKILKEENNLEV